MNPDKPSLLMLYDTAWRQFQEDRKTLEDLYKDLKTQVVTKEEYAVNGINLGKYAELMTKNTAMLIELVKLSHRENPGTSELSEEEIQMAHAEIAKEELTK